MVFHDDAAPASRPAIGHESNGIPLREGDLGDGEQCTQRLVEVRVLGISMAHPPAARVE
jgi:hypothetical protein